MAGMSDAKFRKYMGKQNAFEIMKSMQYNIGLLEAQPIENVTKVLTTYYSSLIQMKIGRQDAALGKERAITYKLMHNVLARKIKRKLVNNPNPEDRLNRVIADNSPEVLAMAIIAELDRILPDLITDCVVERVPLNGLRDLRRNVAKIKAAYIAAEFKIVETKLRF